MWLQKKFFNLHGTSFSIVAVMSVIFIMLGLLYYHNTKEALLKTEFENLGIIAELKSDQVEHWYRERVNDAAVFTKSPLFIASVENLIASPDNRKLREILSKRLALMRDSYKHISVLLTDNDGKLIVGKGPADVLTDSCIITLIHNAAKGQNIINSDITRTASGNHLHISIFSPLLNSTKKTIGVLVVQIDPEAEFYPFIETWPAKSKTAETMIIKKTGDSVLYLSRLRYKRNAQSLFSVPVSRPYIPAVQAVLGNSGQYQGEDYRGVQVMSVIRALSFNNWFLIVKKDRSEILDELFSNAVVISLIVLLLIFIGTLLLLYRNVSVKRRAAAKLHAKELELLKSQAMFKSTMDCLVDGVIITDKDSQIVYMNDSAVELTGYQKSEANLKLLNEIYRIKNEITGELVSDVVGKIKKMGGLKELANHTLLISRDGYEIPISDAGSPIMNGDNTFHGVVLTFRNEIEKRHQRHLLEESEERLRSTLENLLEGCQIVGYDWTYQYLNKAAVAFSKQTLSDLIGKTIQECYPGFEETEMFNALNKSMTERVYNEFDNIFVYPDGSKAWFRLLIQPVPNGLFIMSSDVTEQKAAEAALQHSNEKYRILIDNTPDLIYSLDLEFKHTSVNKSVCAAYCKTENEILGRDYHELGFRPEVTESWFELLEHVKELNTTVSKELSLSLSDGLSHVFEVVFIPIKDETGNLTGIRGVSRDITKKLRTEQKLNESLQSFQMVLKGVDAGTWIWFFTDNYVKFNARYHEILGYEPGELSNDVNSITGLVHPQDLTIVQNLLQQHIEGKTDFLACDIRMKHKSGKWIWISTRGKIIEIDKSGNPVKMSGIAIDITEQKLVAEALRASHLRYQHLVAELNEIIWTASLDGKMVMDINDAFSNIYGIYSEQIVNDPQFWLEAVHPDDREIAERSSQDLFKKGKTEVEYRVVKPDGTIVWLLDKKSVIYNENGEAIQIGGIATDITERKLTEEKLRHSEARFRSLIENSSDVFMVLDKGLHINFASYSFERIVGYSVSNVLGNSFQNFIFEEDKEHLLKIFDQVQTHPREIFTATFRQITYSQSLCWFEAKLVNWLDEPSINGIVVNYRDITERLQVQDELFLAKEKAEEHSRLKSSFLANMSHELRTPLIGILGFSEFLMQDLTDPELNEMAERINKCGIRLSDTLNLILDLSKLEADRMDFRYEQIDLIPVATEVFNSFTAFAEKKNIHYSFLYNVDFLLMGIDKRAITSILTNLLNNALKFTAEGSVNLAIYSEGKAVTIQVADSGIGIDPVFHSIIFDEFRQVSEGVSRNFEGAGLGLSITKKLIDKFGGSITLSSNVGEGAVFTVLFPTLGIESSQINFKQPAAIVPSEIPETENNKPVALLIDDDPMAYSVLKRYVKNRLDIFSTQDGESALKLLRVRKYDIIFMDINLGHGIDGIEATKAILAIPGYATTPIIALTAYAMTGDKEEFLAAGCTHYVSKPFGADTILTVLDEIISVK